MTTLLVSKKNTKWHEQLVGEMLFARLAGLHEIAYRRDDFVGD